MTCCAPKGRSASRRIGCGSIRRLRAGGADARLLPRRGCRWPPLLAVPARALRTRRRDAALVPAWAVCMTVVTPNWFAPAIIPSCAAPRRRATDPRALALGYSGLGLCDRNSVAGVVRALGALEDFARTMRALRASAENSSLLAGARLVFSDGAPDVAAYPANRAGWGQLCRLLTIGKTPREKRRLPVGLDDLLADARRSFADPAADAKLSPRWKQTLAAPARRLSRRIWLGVNMPRGGADRRRLHGLREHGAGAGRQNLLAQNDALYAVSGRSRLAGCADLRARTYHAGAGRPPAGEQCRAASEDAAGNGAAFCRCAGGDRGNRELFCARKISSARIVL